MIKTLRSQIGKIIGKSIVKYHSSKLKPLVDDLEYKERYQGRILDCMVGEVDDNYIETPETDNPVVKLEYSKEGVVKIPSLKGNTILVDADGNETDTPAEGCKLLSVGEQEDNKLIILSKNKNLFDGKLELGSLYSDGTLTGSNDCVRTVNYIKVKPNTTYILSNDKSYTSNLYLYDHNHSFIKAFSTKLPFTTSVDCEYIKFRTTISKQENDLSVKFQLEEGTQSTTYIEPKSYKTEILLDEPLRSLPNGVYDNIVKIGGKWCIVKNCKKVVVDGSENGWTLVKDNGNNITFRLHNNLVTDAYINPPCISNLFIQDMTSGLIKADNSMRITEYSSEQRLFLVPTKDKCSDLQSFKQWLSENPVTIIYQLAEPSIEELPNGIALQGFDDTTMYIENSITPTVQYGYNALIPYKEELSQQKEEVETNTLDIENNIIPYLLDMEFNLMLMEDK